MIFLPQQIKEILRKRHISISRRRGQNFLVDSNIQKKIIQAVNPNKDDEILEIGPGLGALTEDLFIKAKKLYAVEKDKALFAFLKERFTSCNNLELIHQDFLLTQLKKLSDVQLKVVGNLPYYVSTPIIAHLFQKNRKKVKDIFITIQDEVGKRYAGEKGTKEYSSISLLVQYFSSPQILFSIPKKAFYPQPKVNSVFMHLKVREEPPVFLEDEEQFFKIVRACFQQRRKTLLNSLSHHVKSISKAQLQEILEKCSIDYHARAEALGVEDFAVIENILHLKGVRL